MSEHKVTVDTVCNTIASYYKDANTDLVKKAYLFSKEAHGDQTRSSGDPYIVHPTEVAQILAEMHLDIHSVCTGFLHDTIEDTAVTREEIEKEFGSDIAELVDGVTKLSKISFKTSEERQAENFRKMIVAMAKDIRVILVKLADRLNNMRTLQHLPNYKQQSIAQETLDIYAPIANRLGISWIKTELEDLCLRYSHPDIYTKVSAQVNAKKKDRDAFIEHFIHDIEEYLKEYSIKARIGGRAKHFYSIYKKMDARKVTFDQIHDLIAFRLIVDNITECYKALGVIHAAYRPIPGRFKDYIAMPKANGYQSLHTTVMTQGGVRVEIQIRTQEMHQVAEKGIAAHWQYKEGNFDSRSRENIEWVNRLLEWHRDLSDPTEFLETVKIDLFAEDVFVFTPNGDVRQLPHGSTPIDFAYAIHTDVGNKCIGAKVNGKIVPLKHRLKSGDAIEIITSPSQTPSKDWLKIARSSRAKAKIRAFIKTQERNKAQDVGRSILERALKHYSVPSLNKLEKSGDVSKAAQSLSYRSDDELYISIGYGHTPVDSIVSLLVPKDQLKEKSIEDAKIKKDETFLSKVFTSVKNRSESKNAIRVSNHDDILVRFAKCCSPVPGDSIVGYITRGRGVTIHTATCAKALDSDPARRVEVAWNVSNKPKFKRAVKIRVLTLDQPGLLALMSQAISSMGVNISSANIRTTKDKKAIALFDVEVMDIAQLHKVTSKLEAQEGVLSVERVRS